MYREGLPAAILVIGLSFAILVIATLLLEPSVLAIILSVIAAIIILTMIKRFKRNKNTLVLTDSQTLNW